MTPEAPAAVGEMALAVRLGVAALAGLTVGVEREWSGRAVQPSANFAGLRTFLLFGLLGGVAGLCLAAGHGAAGAAVLAGGGAVVALGYAASLRLPGHDAGGTTEAAALVVLGLGTLAGLGHLALAAGTTAVVTLALGEKARLHWLVAQIGERELRAALQFAVLATVVLPLLPDRPIGPGGGIRLRHLWAIVLLLSALNFAGYLARRAAGAARGYALTGLLGGLVSSTAVTVQFARRSLAEPQLGVPLAAGVVGACTVLLPRVLVVSVAIEPRVALALLPFLLPPAALGAAVVGIALWRRRDAGGAAPPDERSPLRLRLAIEMAVFFQLALILIAVVRETWGTPGVLATAAALGLTNMDALAISMSRMGRAPDATGLAARAIAIGILANTLLKFVVSVALGGGGFRRPAAAGLALLAAASLAGLWLGRLWLGAR